MPVPKRSSKQHTSTTHTPKHTASSAAQKAQILSQAQDVELIVSGAEQLPFAMKELSQQVQEGLPPSIALTLGV